MKIITQVMHVAFINYTYVYAAMLQDGDTYDCSLSSVQSS